MRYHVHSATEVEESAAEAANALNRLADEQWFGGNSAPHWSYFERRVIHFIGADLDELDAEFDRLRGVAQGLNRNFNSNLHHTLKVLTKVLFDWNGETADACQRQLSNIETFLVSRSERLNEVLNGLATIKAIEMAARGNHIRLTQAIMAQCDKAIEGVDAQTTEYIVTGIAEGVKRLIDWKKLVDDSIDATADAIMALSGKPTFIDATDSAAIVDHYIEAHRAMLHDYQAALDAVTDNLSTALAQIENEKKLLAPLPPSTNVTSPDFRWERFVPEGTTVPPHMDTRVERERERYRKELEAPAKDYDYDGGFQPSEIEDVLDGE